MVGEVIIGTGLDTKGLEKDLKKTEKEISKYQNDIEKMTDTQKQLEVEVVLKGDEFERKIKEIREKQKIQLESNVSGRPMQRQAREEKINATADMQVNKLIEERDRYYAMMDEKQGSLNKKLEESKTLLSGAEKKAKDLNDKLTQVQAYEKVKGKIGEVGNALKNLATKGDLKGITKGIDNVSKSVKGIVGRILKWGLALFGIRTAYNYIRQSANAVFQQNEGLANQVQLMKNALSMALEPLIKNIVSLVYTLFMFVNQIFQKLTGRNLFAEASKNLQKGAGSAKEINKQLAGFDEMNVLSDNNAGGGGAGGGLDTSGFVGENEKLMEILNKFKDMVENGDWAGIAQTISKGIIDGLNAIADKIKSIDWTGIGKAISEFLTNIDFSGILTSLVRVFGEAVLGLQNMMLAIDWPTVFGNLSQGIADAISKVGEYLKQIKWSEIGTMLSDTFASIKWTEIGSNIISTIATALSGIWDLLTAIDWGKVASTMSDAITTWLGQILTLIGQTDWEQLGMDIANAIIDFITNVDWLQIGADIVAGLAMGMGSLLDMVVGVFKALVNKILEFFGISSPSTLFSDIGNYIMEGLINGLESLVNTVVNIFKTLWDNIKSIFTSTLNWIKSTIITPLGNLFSNLWNNFKNNVSNAVNVARDIFNGLIGFLRGVVNTVFGFFSGMASNVANTLAGAVKGAINSVLIMAENAINNFFKMINKAVNTINKIPGVNISKLSMISLPRLEKGGIINQPGRGVMVGSAIGGERGKEGVIPLTDSQQMALLGESIGRYITINANIINSMNGKVLSREMQRIKNEESFANNR